MSFVMQHLKYFCISITFNYPITVCFFVKKCPVTIQTRATQILNNISLIQKPLLIDFLNVIDVPNQSSISFSILKVRNPTPHTRITKLGFNINYKSKST